MGFEKLVIKNSYISCGDDNIAKSFLVPALKEAKTYKRSVGFFSSSAFAAIIDGVIGLVRNGGEIQLIASPKLTKEDIEAINLGYEKRVLVEQAFNRQFIASIEELDDAKLNLLANLIASNILDIKIAVSETLGMYHDKLGIIEDKDGNTLVFYGSANATLSGYQNNYEKIRVLTSFNSSDVVKIEEEKAEFNSLWAGTNKFVATYDYKTSAKKNILTVIEKRNSAGSSKRPETGITLRDYQEQAIEAWNSNGHKGFFVMATGTGKTWTAIFAAKRLVEKKPAFIVICAPYKHLVSQWSEDVKTAFPEAKVILVSSENPGWEKAISDAIIQKRYRPKNQIIVISTIASFRMDRFNQVIQKSTEDKLLIVDEAHRFTDRAEDLKDTYKYMLGLSATPFSGTSAQKGLELMKFFGGQVFNLPIEDALEKGFLVPYNYYPLCVYANADEEGLFKYHTQKILSCFKNNRLINHELLVKSLRNRLRVISMASEKMKSLDSFIDEISSKDHFVVYCGDGRLFDNKANEELRHIQAVKRVLSDRGIKTSQFTATESMAERMKLVNSFDKGYIDSLVAIRCLDEGINIPSIKSALILSSNDDYREFVQRRGRILRKYKGKEFANIYDVIVLPSVELSTWAKIELRRYYEYARLALNWDTLELDLDGHLAYYGLSLDDINVFDYTDVEDTIDE